MKSQHQQYRNPAQDIQRLITHKGKYLITLCLLLSLSACVHAQVKQQFGGVGSIGGVTGIQSNVTPQLQIVTTSCAPGVLTQAYQCQLQANFGVLPLSWAVVSGSLPNGLTLDAPSGLISGIPGNNPGTTAFTIRVTDSASTPQTANQNISITIACSQILVTTPLNLPVATQGTPYSQALTEAGGMSAFTWSLVAGSTLPPGESLSGASITGTPTLAGNYSFQLKVTDSCTTGAQSVISTFTEQVNSNLAVTTASVPNGTVGQNYSQTLSVAGGTGPYVWTLSVGTLPAGLSLSSAGAITGAPTAVGTSQFTVKVTDSLSNFATANLSISTACTPLQITSPGTICAGTQGQPYSCQMTASGGFGADRWASAGLASCGLAIAPSTGIISGTPSCVGSFTPTISVTDSCPTPQTQSGTFAIIINPQIPQLGFSTTSPLQTPTTGIPFTQQVNGRGGVPPYTFALIGGSFPAGISMNAAGAISGTATQAVTTSPQIQVTDAQPLNSNTVFSMTSACPTLNLSPASNTVLSPGTQGSNYSSQISGTGGYSGLSYAATGLPTGLTIGLSTGLISGIPSVSGQFTPVVTVTDSCSPTPQTITNNYTLTINSNLAVTTATLPNGVTGTVYSATESAAGGTPAYAFTVTAGALPTGLALSSAGAITGTPTVIGNFTFTVTVTDSLLATATQQYTVTISGSAAGCGTNASGTPTNNKQCGTAGTNVYTGEGSATNFNQWCATPGTSCLAITSCNQTLTSGTPTSHRKYYLPADLNCGPASLAFFMTKYTDANLNGHTLTGVIFRNGGMRGLHLFNGVVNCSLTTVPTQVLANQFAYACLDNENNGGTYLTSAGGGDEIRVHHISGLQSATTPNPTTGAIPFFMRFTGDVLPPTGGWTEPALVIYNDNFASVPETTNSRQHAGVYAETQPVEYYNNTGNVGASGQATAAQLLEVYGPHSNGTFPNYVHNNFLTCAPYTVVGGDTCRPVLCDGATFCHVAFNDIWPNNNRGVRLRDASNATVDHNFFHQLTTGAGFTGACLQTGGNDVNSGMGQVVTQTSSNNTCELGANTLGVTESGQQGFTSDADTFTCAAAGCGGAVVAKVDYSNGGQGLLPGTAVISSGAFTLTDAGSSFRTGTSFFTGSVVTFTGFSNGANNYPNFFTATAAAATVLTFGAQTLVSESATGIHFIAKNAISFNNYVLGAGVTSNVTVSNQAAGVNTTSLTWCNGTAPVNTNVGATAGQIIHNTGACP